MTDIKFGTDGWRGIIAKDYTFDNLARVAAATADYLKSPSRKSLDIYSEWGTPYREAGEGVVIGYDARFLSERFALSVARILQERGIPCVVSDRAVPTPTLSWTVRDRSAAAGVMITASHNPAEYNGFKFKCEFASSAPPSVTREIESSLPERPPTYDETAEVQRADFVSGYLDSILELVDGERLASSQITAVIDPMFGSAKGLIGEVLDRYDVPYVEIRNGDNPGFEGGRPEPLEEHLHPLIEAVKRESEGNDELLLGVATDGDGDRISSVAEDGSFIDAHRTYSLLLKYLAEVKGWKGKVVKNFPLTDLVFKLGEKHDLPVDETPVGFKYIAEKMIREDVLIGGEESGGIGLKNHIPDRDGILCALFLLELVAETGKNATQIIDDMMDEHGGHYYHRNDIKLEARKEVVQKAQEEPPSNIGRFKVKEVEDLDGIKLRFDEGWMLLRASGTEPLLRIYCEMDEMEKVHACLEEAEKYARELASS